MSRGRLTRNTFLLSVAGHWINEGAWESPWLVATNHLSRLSTSSITFALPSSDYRPSIFGISEGRKGKPTIPSLHTARASRDPDAGIMQRPKELDDRLQLRSVELLHTRRTCKSRPNVLANQYAVVRLQAVEPLF